MKLNKIHWLLVLLSALTLFSLPKPVAADTHTVPLAVLKAGTQQTSYAASYFAHSATVASDGNGVYTVTSTVTTSKKLGNYPVQILSIDGSGANVSKSDDGASQTITYSFQTNDPSQLHNAVIKVDIDNMNYHHVYNVGLKMDTSSLPKEPQTNKPKQAKPDTTADTASQASREKTTSRSASKQNASSNDAASSSTANQASAAAASRTTDTNEAADQTDFMKKVAAVVGSGLGLGVLAAGITIWFKSRKK